MWGRVCSPPLVSLSPPITPSPPLRPRHHVSIHPPLPYRPTTNPFLISPHFHWYAKAPAYRASLTGDLHTGYVNITKLSMMTFWIPNHAWGEESEKFKTGTHMKGVCTILLSFGHCPNTNCNTPPPPHQTGNALMKWDIFKMGLPYYT